MSVQELLSELSVRKIHLYSENGKLKYKSYGGKVDENLLTLLRKHKDFLLQIAGGEEEPLKMFKAEGNENTLPLTSLQSAYWVGEKDFYQFKAVGYFYEEYESDFIDADLLDFAFNIVIRRHPFLQLIITEDGLQKKVENIKSFKSVVHDFNNDADAAERFKESLRADAPGFMGTINDWPLFSVQIIKCKGKYVLFLIGRLIFLDAHSWEIVLSEVFEIYSSGGKTLPEDTVPFSFFDYQYSLEKQKNHKKYLSSTEYWENRLNSLPDAPVLPVRSLHSAKENSLKRKDRLLKRETWEKAKMVASEKGISPTVLAFAAFAHVIRNWSKYPHFLLNMMYSRRIPLNSYVSKIVGNFSSTLLVEVNLTEINTFLHHALILQKQILNDLDNGLVSGVEIVRALRSGRSAAEMPTAPVVFASTFDFSDEKTDYAGFRRFGWKRKDGKINTPQVWLDHQLIESDEGLHIRWDYNNGIYEDTLIEEMITGFYKLLSDLATDETWQKPALFPLSNGHEEVRRNVNNTKTVYPEKCLHQLFFEAADQHKYRLALECGSVSFTYQELKNAVLILRSQLKNAGVKKGDIVGILYEKGWRQVVSALAILSCDAIYVPLDINQPEERLKYLIDHIKPAVIVTDLSDISGFPVLSVPAEADLKLPLTDFSQEILFDPDSVAYIIFTSGSTGVPKGVVIKHAAAVNTILDINRLINLSENDKCFAISALSFDLSVYDIFGLLAAGGAIVIPESGEERDPASWYKIITNRKITVWNSAPAFMEMLAEYGKTKDAFNCGTIKTVLLSGDWIPLPLYDQISTFIPSCRFISLGGATEASIWSNYFEVKFLPESWKSIPYGYPLANQTYRVLDSWLQDRPANVPGHIFIGGKGLSEGYFNDQVKTDAAFITHPVSKERLYKTGDWGQYWEDGILEFLGREDAQVKIRGFRIELGDIESNLQTVDCVDKAIVLVADESGKNRRLVAFVKLSKPAEEAEIKFKLSKKLPSYMIPAAFVFVEDWPVTSNGKFNRKGLLEMYKSRTSINNSSLKMSPFELRISGIWKKLLMLNEVALDESFFASGGNSVLAIRLVNELEKEFGISLPYAKLFELETIKDMAAFIEASARNSSVRFSVQLTKGAENLFCFHPIGGGISCYLPLVDKFGDDLSIVAFQGLDLQNGKGLSLEDLAREYMKELLQIQPQGPYYLLGWSFGGIVAYHIASMLESEGKAAKLIMLDPWVPKGDTDIAPPESIMVKNFLQDLCNQKLTFPDDIGGDPDKILEKGIQILASADPDNFGEFSVDFIKRLFRVYYNNCKALVRYRFPAVNQETHIIEARQKNRESFFYLDPLSYNPEFNKITYPKLSLIAGNHYTCWEGQGLEELVDFIGIFFNLPNYTDNVV
jgi:amino acid adenylation domain-containing protein